MNLPGISAPKALDLTGNVAEKWREWNEKFEIYLIAIGYEDKSEKIKTGVMLNVIGEEANELFRGFEFAEDTDKWKYKEVVKKFQEHCQGRKSTFRNREALWSLKQTGEQTIDQFLSEIRRKIQDCDIEDKTLKDSLIKQRLIAGIKDDGCRGAILNKGDELTLEVAIKMARNAEATKKELKDLGFGQQPREVHAVGRIRRGFRGRGQSTHKTQQSCYKCGRYHAPRQCPAFGKKCAKCGGQGHFAVVCKTPQASRQR